MNRQYLRSNISCIEQHIELVEYYKENIETELTALKNHCESIKQELKRDAMQTC